MKKRNAVLAALAAAAMLAAAGCGQKPDGDVWKADENSIYVTRAMEVESALTYTSPQANELYSREELENYAADAVSRYNQENGGQAAASNTEGQEKLPAALKSCTLEGQTGTLVFEYRTPGDFVKFAEATDDNTNTVTSLTVRRVSEELTAGGLADEKQYRKADGREAALEDVMKQSDYVVVAVEGAAAVYTEGNIAFVSGDGTSVSVTGSHRALTSEGKHYIIFK